MGGISPLSEIDNQRGMRVTLGVNCAAALMRHCSP